MKEAFLSWFQQRSQRQRREQRMLMGLPVAQPQGHHSQFGLWEQYTLELRMLCTACVIPHGHLRPILERRAGNTCRICVSLLLRIRKRVRSWSWGYHWRELQMCFLRFHIYLHGWEGTLPPCFKPNEKSFQSSTQRAWALLLNLENTMTDTYLRYKSIMWKLCSRCDQINQLDLNTVELEHPGV